MSLRSYLAEFQVAVMLLTRLPAGRIDGDAPDLARARWAFPLVGGLVGLLTWCAYALASTVGTPSLVAALLAMTSLAMLTGALHFDGLADFADGIGGGRDKEHALEIMRDSRIGSYGVLALVLAAGLWTACVAHSDPGPLEFIGAAVLSRAGMVLLQDVMAPARGDGLGHLAAGKNLEARGVVLVCAFVGLLVSPQALVACVVAIGLVAWLAHRKIGGQTGDVLGAGQLSAETLIWVVLSTA